ncbi:MAG: hypothetical protein CO150_01515 [Nitrospirae bacterium CG_4_9_14_3_um_filter_53_35]|nr:MAG: hypothetical protein AUK29_04640 [Nitrospirae bacterium CG2_30_53_67]PIS37708.1 MAG: hypothetical protein COT35_04650 [Nitrospirae bacterium CG08_land_8_20_14_0_20_52_24]PIV85045.1 MAG: hypothetical protein COW52_04380 [Nitrospirae bacterium CG17_big_fil_post_rev_8_21_14_2_50_50_9]PIW86269.1 MAG: hypothetical protein COZ95_00165 [Nitrospirae bacterium CG_4_8_14_3_um_filter_50_41]PIX85856.1 MAG: hypothetical protein COZ32_06345 [Nitrospirae bacterium CG_4_10_14_3_um_filter_53_41]PJA7732
MTKLIIEADDNWTRERIKIAIDTEAHVLRKTVERIRNKITEFEKKYGSPDRKKLYGKIGDMELLEWEGEIETLKRVERKLKSLEEINFEYR